MYLISRAVERSDSTSPTKKCCLRKELESTMKALRSPPNTVEMNDDWLVVEPICKRKRECEGWKKERRTAKYNDDRKMMIN